MKQTIEVLIDNRFILSIDDNSDITIVKQISDIREFTKRTNPYTIPFTVPSNANNDQIFDHYNNINNDEFNTRTKVPVVIRNAGKDFFNGYLQMNKSSSSDGYQITCYSNLDIINPNGRLKDYDFSEWNHEYTYENVVGSWDSFVIRGGNKINFSKGTGYVYPYVDNVHDRIAKTLIGDLQGVETEFFLPSFYAKTIWDKLYQDNDLSYVSNFLNSDKFRSLVIVNGENEYKYDGDITEFNFAVANLDNQTYTSGYAYIDANASGVYGGMGTKWSPLTTAVFRRDTPTLDPITGEVLDDLYNPSGYFNIALFGPGSRTYTVQRKSRMNFEAQIYLDSTISVWKDENGTTITECQNNYKGIHDGDVTYYVYLTLVRGTQIIILDSNQLNAAYTQLSSCDNCIDLDEINLKVSVQDYLFLPGDEVRVDVRAKYHFRSFNSKDVNDCNAPYNPDFQVGTRCRLNVNYSKFLGEVVDDKLYVGDWFNLNRIVPDMSSDEFISSIVKMFNLYILPDKDNPKVHYIEPYDDFFNFEGEITNWSRKLDLNSELTREPLDDINSRLLRLTYTLDNDYLNNTYNTKWDEVFGQYIVDSGSEFKTGTQDETVKFASTPLVNEKESLNDKVITKIYKYTNGEESQVTFKPRILHYNLLECNTWIINNDYTATFSATYSHNNYPYVGFLDVPERPTSDLNFFFCKEYYHILGNNNLLTFNNLYNLYWSNYFGNLLNASSLLTGYFHLTPKDIYEFDFRNLVYLNGNYYIVNKIEYNVNGLGLSKVELIKTGYFSVANKFINQNVSQYATYVEGGIGHLTGDNNIYPIRPGSNLISSDYISVNNGIKGLGNSISELHLNNILYGNNSILSGDNSIGMGNSSQFHLMNNSLGFGNNISTIGSVNNSLLLGNYIYGSESSANSLMVGNNITYEETSSSVVIGNDITLLGVKQNMFIFGSGFTHSATFSEYEFIVGTNGGYVSASILDMVEITSEFSNLFDQATYSIPILTGTGITTSNIFYNFTNNKLQLSATTASYIVFQNTVGSGSLGDIVWLDGVTEKHSIKTDSNLVRISAFSDLYLNVNSIDVFKIGYGPYMGVNNNISGVLFNIGDNGWNSDLFRITSTASVTLLNYNNSGVLENRNNIKLGLTSSGYVLKSPDGTDWKISVDNSGTLIVGTSI